MKTVIRKSADGHLTIGAETLRQAGLSIPDELELHVSGGMIVITKAQMSANELRESMDELMALGGEFSRRANEICAGCDGEDCPYLGDEDDEI